MITPIGAESTECCLGSEFACDLESATKCFPQKFQFLNGQKTSTGLKRNTIRGNFTLFSKLTQERFERLGKL